jgi:hypothetical protein
LVEEDGCVEGGRRTTGCDGATTGATERAWLLDAARDGGGDGSGSGVRLRSGCARLLSSSSSSSAPRSSGSGRGSAPAVGGRRKVGAPSESDVGGAGGRAGKGDEDDDSLDPATGRSARSIFRRTIRRGFAEP